MFLTSHPLHLDIVTSDIADDGDVENNIRFNFDLNNLTSSLPLHVPYTWGDGSWNETILKISNNSNNDEDNNNKEVILQKLKPESFQYIVASDILLYVSVYPKLVETLCELFCESNNNIQEFLMSWNRLVVIVS